jgi:hypothetical protein
MICAAAQKRVLTEKKREKKCSSYIIARETQRCRQKEQQQDSNFKDSLEKTAAGLELPSTQ